MNSYRSTNNLKSSLQFRLKLDQKLHSRQGQEGSLLLVGLLIATGLVVSSAGIVWLLQSGKLGASLGNDANNAQAIAEAGADQIIGVWNEPQNRRLLVAGDEAPTNWSTTNQTSPCLSSTNTRPGPVSDAGNPSAIAKTLVDGNFRNIDDITKTATGDRQFRLKAIRYSTGEPGNTNRRTISRTYKLTDSKQITTVGTITGNFRDLINPDDPDGAGAVQAGVNTGYIAVEVESKVLRNGVQIGTATVTKEFQVLPKCCGGSFGSNNTGGQNFVGSGSLGSDSRYCGVDFGMIVGINGGKFWTYYANDVYHTINPSTGSEINLRSILGSVTNASYKFERNVASADSNNGCRVIPGPCSTSTDVYTTSGTSDLNLFANINCGQCGTANDKAGKSASGIPIIPLFINGGLPSVNSRFGYTWTSGSPPATAFATTKPGPSLTSTGKSTKLRLRTRNDTTPPRVEFCDATYLACTSTSPRNSWAQISLPQGTTSGTLTIADDFASNGYSGTSSGSINRWADIWMEQDPSGAAQSTSAGNVTINGTGDAAFLRLSGISTTTNVAAERVVNLHALRTPFLKFTYTKFPTLAGTKDLVVEYSTDNGANYTALLTVPLTTATGSNLNVALPLAAQTGYTKLRFRLASNFASGDWIGIDNVAITDAAATTVATYDNWCEYSSSRPVTAQFTGGFHCLGPSLDFSAGGNFIVDTSGGSLSLYYNSLSDTRGQSLASPLINMANGAELQHVNCPNVASVPQIPPQLTVTPTDNCTTGIPQTVYAAVGENDMLNIFGSDKSPSGTNMQWVRIGSTSSTTGKISGAFIYMPWGAVYLIADQCDGTGPAAASYNFSGRVWLRYLIACGSNWFVVPPSSTMNLAALGINSNVSVGDANFVGWTGTDWQASTVSATLINASL